MPPLPPSPDRHPVTSPSRSSSSDSSYAPPPLDDRHHPHAASPSRTTSLTMPNDRLSLRSFVSTSESTAVSDHPTVTKSPGLEYAYTLAPQKSISYYHNPGKLAPPRRSRSGDHNVVTYDGTSLS
ncbi:hypothetical protein BDN70DRAFT_870144 [Pholiota conissans]|uniref:Uncharacterized protein n=1 Tax=Pholiota conissans TaxID=109636 RepID=A0A9P5ZGA7_9AGAR|nr:hypothetical protein BDN70DRAFT_870144 [Pholiota conissans]